MLSKREIRVVIFGLGAKLDLFLNYFRNMDYVNVIGVVSMRKQVIESVDGIPILEMDDLYRINYDIIYALDPSIRKNPVVAQEIRWKMIDEYLLYTPHFSLEKYLNIREQKWCIISEDCWASICYHYMEMPFTSPFIMTHIQDTDYYKMLQNLSYFLCQDLELEREEGNFGHAVGRLGTKDGGVKIDLWHNRNFAEAKAKWEQRRMRMDANSPILIQKTIKNDEDAYRFSQLPYEHKVGFYHKPMDLEGIVYLEGWNDPEIRYRSNWVFNVYVRNMLQRHNNPLVTFNLSGSNSPQLCCVNKLLKK